MLSICFAMPGRNGRGDRCFDGRPDALKAFLEKHPEYMQPGVRKDAITFTPAIQPSALSPEAAKKKTADALAAMKQACDELWPAARSGFDVPNRLARIVAT